MLEPLEPRILLSATPRAGGPRIGVADASVLEGTGGSTQLVFVLTRTGNAAQLNQASTVAFETRGGTDPGEATPSQDFTPRTGSVTFNPGQRTRKVAIAVNPDALYEGGKNTTETLRLKLTGVTGGQLVDDLALGAIADDDRRPRLSVADSHVVEGDTGVTILRFTVRLSNPSQDNVSVEFETLNRTATAGVDYLARSGTLIFTPGQDALTIDVTVLNNLGSQGHRQFDLALRRAVGAAIATPQAVGTIIDDESTPVLLLTDVAVLERDSGQRFKRITLRLSHAGASDATVQAITQGVTATAGQDYGPAGGTLTIPAGQTQVTFSLGILGDTIRERHETFNLNFSSPVNLELIDTRLVVTILDDD